MRLRDLGLAARKIGGQIVILDHHESRYLTVKGAGVLLFDLLHQDRDRNELVSAVLEAYDVDLETAGRDVDAFVSDLAGAGLLETVIDLEN